MLWPVVKCMNIVSTVAEFFHFPLVKVEDFVKQALRLTFVVSIWTWPRFTNTEYAYVWRGRVWPVSGWHICEAEVWPISWSKTVFGATVCSTMPLKNSVEGLFRLTVSRDIQFFMFSSATSSFKWPFTTVAFRPFSYLTTQFCTVHMKSFKIRLNLLFQPFIL